MKKQQAKKAKTAQAKTTTKKAAASKQATSKPAGMKESQLMELFVEELKDIYWAEKALTKALPKMMKKATSADLADAIQNHLAETQEQVARVEEVFAAIGKKPQAKKCEAMAGLIKEAEEIMEECEAGAMRDAGIISAAQKVEHYEIASYGTLRHFAETLGFTEAAQLLETTLNEERNADETLTEVATTCVNVEAAEDEA